MKNTSGRAMPHASACRPGIISGRANGRKRMVPNVSRTTRAAPTAASPRAVAITFGRNGAPAAPPSRTKPIACDGSGGITRVTDHANAGATTKFKPSASSTSRTLRSGAVIAPSVSVRPIASMLLRRKTRIDSSSVCRSESAMSGVRPLLSRSQCELSFAREVDRFAENAERFLGRMETRGILRFHKIEIELRFALEILRRGDLLRGRIGGARGFQFTNELDQCVHGQV